MLLEGDVRLWESRLETRLSNGRGIECSPRMERGVVELY